MMFIDCFDIIGNEFIAQELVECSRCGAFAVRDIFPRMAFY